MRLPASATLKILPFGHGQQVALCACRIRRCSLDRSSGSQYVASTYAFTNPSSFSVGRNPDYNQPSQPNGCEVFERGIQ